MISSLHILDGSGFIFRAYHGLPPLTDREGRNINAVLGFIKMLLTLLKQHPSHFLIARDSPHRTKRKENFEAYKAQRVAMPDEFYRQMNTIKDIIQKSGISAFEIEGYEADDIIATAAAHGSKERPACIVSSDKDMRQLISDTVSIYDAQKDITWTPGSFFQQYGFLPEHFVDYQAIVGDVADNIPGVTGIGDVGAKKLVSSYGSLDEIYRHIESITGKNKELLIQYRDNAFLSRELATLMQVPGLFPFGIDDCTLPTSFAKLEHELLKVWRFNSLAGLLKEITANYTVGKQESLFG